MSPLVALALFVAGPKPVDGLAVPIAFLDGVKPFKVTVSKAWSRGVYTVMFEYRSDRGAKTLGELSSKEGFRSQVRGGPTDFGYQAFRTRGPVYQDLILSSRTVPEASGGNRGSNTPQTSTEIYVTERLWTPAQPNCWYKGAIAPNPPVPLVTIPFIAGMKCDSVGLASFDGLMSSKGMRYVGADVRVFSRLIPRPLSEVQVALERWAAGNGYRKTRMGSYFKPHTKLFEIYLRSAKPESCGVTLYVTDRDPTHPIIWEKI